MLKLYFFLKITVLNYFKSEKHPDSQSGLFAYTVFLTKLNYDMII